MAPAATAEDGGSMDLGSSNDVEMVDSFAHGSDRGLRSRLHRKAQGLLSSLPSRTGNIDVAPSGAVLVATRDCIHILNIATGLASFLAPDFMLKNHHDPAVNLPMFHAQIKVADIDKYASETSRAHQNSQGHKDYLKAEAAVLDAKWAPVEIGPMKSPVLAVLTSKRQLVLYAAEDNFLRGPWTPQLCFDDCEPIASFAWVQHSVDDYSATLLAGSLYGSLYAWRISTGPNIKSPLVAKRTDEARICSTCIYGVYISSPHNLANSSVSIIACSRGKVHLRWLKAERDEALLLEPDNAQELTIPGHVSTAAWHGDTWLLCTAGSLHSISAVKASPSTARRSLLQSSDRFDCNVNLPASSAVWLEEEDAFLVTLQDGTYYKTRAEATGSSSVNMKNIPSVTASGYLEPPNEEIGDEQRFVERVRGVFGLKNGGNGLVFLCHDANDIASWTHLRSPKSMFSIAIRSGEKETDGQLAARLLDRMLSLRGDDTMTVEYRDEGTTPAFEELSKCHQTLMILAQQSSKAEHIMRQVYERLLDFIGSLDRTRSRVSVLAAIQIALWIVREDQNKDRQERCLRDILRPLQDVRKQTSLKCLMQGARKENVKDLSASVQQDYKATTTQIKVLLAAAQALDAAVARGPLASWSDSAEKLVRRLSEELVGAARTSQLITAQRNASDRSDGHLQTGEECRVCKSPLLLNSDDLSSSTCIGTGKHRWERCATTYAIITKPRTRKCVLCARETIHPDDAQNVLQRFLLGYSSADDSWLEQVFLPPRRCGVCGGAWVAVS